jgi:hypothetical protein
MRFDAAERIAHAVLYEGYVLYPYRASSVKNRVRWQFGIVAPRPPGESDVEPWFSQTECILAAADSAQLWIRLRCLRAGAVAENAGEEWLNGIPHTIDLPPITVAAEANRDIALDVRGVRARMELVFEPSGDFIKTTLRVENLEPWSSEYSTDRDAMLRRALIGAHVLLSLDGGRFVSMLDPEPAAETLVASCRNVHTWPVLVGDRRRRDLMLSSPIVLYDYPSVASESPGDLCDATEIDEILSLRIMTLTDDEKREARATDPRAKEIIDRVDGMTPDSLAALHGTMRSAEFFNPPGAPSPEDAAVTVGDRSIGKGARVRLRPNRRADAMDMFLKDQSATVAGVFRDVDERVYVAVTVDKDPGAELHASFGRYFYFDPAEIEPLDSNGEVQ